MRNSNLRLAACCINIADSIFLRLIGVSKYFSYLCVSSAAYTGGQGPPDGADGEEAERCPICLGVLAGGELAMPDSCCHVFCLRCLLTWAEVTLR